MKKSAVIIACYLLTIHCVTTLIYETINTSLVNRSVNRTFYTKNQLVHIDYEILMEYHGNSSAVGFIFSVESMIAKNVVHLEATQLDSSTESKLRIREANIENLTGIYWFISFKHALHKRNSVLVKTSVVLARHLRPLPAYINQEDAQLVILHASHYFYSAYCTFEQNTVVKLPSLNVESYPIIKPTKKYTNAIFYGPYSGVRAFNTSDMVIHFEYNAPLLTVRSLKRVIKISQWGNIAVAERIKLQNTGAVLKGSFSRYVHMMRYELPDTTSADHIKVILPKSARNIYYLDDLGNISTSYVMNTEDSTELKLHFRYPLLGGWNISLIFGYDVPASEYIFHIEDDYVLQMPLINNLYEGMFVETMETMVIIPEGAIGGELVTPVPVEKKGTSKYYMLLDTIGRIAVNFHINNLTDKHIQYFQVQYQFPKTMLIYKPLQLICMIFILLVLIWTIKNYEILLDFGSVNYCNEIPGRNTVSEANRCKTENE